MIENSIDIESDLKNLELYNENYPFRLPLRIKNFENEADYKRFAKNCERTIRYSVEYKLWRRYIIDVLGINRCMITEERIDECSLEVHHHIPSLYVVVKTIINKNIEKEEKFSTFDVSLEAIKLHFQNKIGYLVMVGTLHEKLHNGFLEVPISMVKGNYNGFISEYFKYIDDEDLETINYRMSVNNSNCLWSRDNYPGGKVR